MILSPILLSTVIAAGAESSPAALAEASSLDFELAPVALADTVSFTLLQDEAGAETEAPPEDAHRRVAHFGAKGSKRFNIRGGVGVDVKTDNQMGLLGVGFSYFIADSLSLDLELQGMMFTQEIQSAEGFNANLLFRWHFINKRDWSVYLDGGGGVLLSTQDVPADGSSFNFTPQAGLGFTFALGEGARFMAGGRWYHTSNANLYDANPGRDNVLGYVGVSFPF